LGAGDYHRCDYRRGGSGGPAAAPSQYLNKQVETRELWRNYGIVELCIIPDFYGFLLTRLGEFGLIYIL
jgi:hypothetical protein